jgi:hypothetical protein
MKWTIKHKNSSQFSVFHNIFYDEIFFSLNPERPVGDLKEAYNMVLVDDTSVSNNSTMGNLIRHNNVHLIFNIFLIKRFTGSNKNLIDTDNLIIQIS